MAWVVETENLKTVPIRINKVAPTREARAKEMEGVVPRKLCGVKTENSLPEMTTARTLPRPVKAPPQSRG